MHTKIVGLTALVSLSLIACGGSAVSSSASPATGDESAGTGQTSSAVSICDGSSGTRFLYRVGGGTEQAPVGQIVMTENGGQILSIDGACHFWTYDSFWGQVRTGVVDAKMATDLSNALHVDQWSAWQADAASQSSGCIGCSGGEVRFGSSTLDLTFDGTKTSGLSELAKLVGDDFKALQSAPEVTGAVRIMLYEISDPSGQATVPWPLTVDPQTLALDQGTTKGTSKLISDPDDAAKLRAIRDPFLAGTYGARWYNGEIDVVSSDGTTYGMWFRDVMPGEDADGLTHLL
ncbi:MAG: hypothetical protein ABI551_21005 [Polyangiaceae bacterium]